MERSFTLGDKGFQKKARSYAGRYLGAMRLEERRQGRNYFRGPVKRQ